MARPSEIKAVADVLMEPADDVKDVAKAAIQALDTSREDRTDYMICVRTGSLVAAYGPYATRKQAEKAIEKQQIPALDGSSFHVVAYRHPKAAAEAWARADESPVSDEARKIWAIARNGGQAANTHSRRNRRRS